MSGAYSFILTLLISFSSLAEYIAQDDNYSCGPVAIYNALNYKGKHVSLDEIRRVAKTKPKDPSEGGGTTVADFVIAAEFFLQTQLAQIPTYQFKRSGTYLIMMTVHTGSIDNQGAHVIFVNDGIAYNIKNGKVETELDYLIVQGMLYPSNNGVFPIVWEIQ